MRGKPVARTKKSEHFALRLTSRMRFGLELLARKLGTNVGGAMIFCVEEIFTTEHIGLLLPPRGKKDELVNVVDFVWSPLEYERFARLGEYFPDFLSDEERYLWRTLQDEPKYWKQVPMEGERAKKGPPGQVRKIDLEKLGSDWAKLKTRAGIQS